VHWLAAEPHRLTSRALRAAREAEELAVASITWYELAWLAEHGRISPTRPMRSWLEGLAEEVRTVGITAAIAATAVALPRSFPGDPADRLIYATALEYGWSLITSDQQMRGHDRARQVTIW
jgi:PIN domain nuclease of toxin-antitoxin system